MKTWFTLLAILAIATNSLFASEEDVACSIQLNFDIQTDFYNKKIGNNPVSKQKGHIQLCIDQAGVCNWTSKGSLPTIQHIDFIMQSLDKTSQAKEVNQLLGLAKTSKATQTNFSDGYMGIRKSVSDNQEQVIIIDPSRNLIVGANYYDKANKLVQRLVFKYGNDGKETQLKTASYLILDKHGLATKEYVLQFQLIPPTS